MFPKCGRLLVANVALGSPGSYPNKRYRLSTNIPGGSADDVVEADFTEATFPGYAEIVDPAIPPATLDGTDRGKLVTPTLTWTAGVIVTPETIKCIYLVYTGTGPTDDGLVYWKELPAWVTIANLGEQVNQIVSFYDQDFTP